MLPSRRSTIDTFDEAAYNSFLLALLAPTPVLRLAHTVTPASIVVRTVIESPSPRNTSRKNANEPTS